MSDPKKEEDDQYPLLDIEDAAKFKASSATLREFTPVMEEVVDKDDNLDNDLPSPRKSVSTGAKEAFNWTLYGSIAFFLLLLTLGAFVFLNKGIRSDFVKLIENFETLTFAEFVYCILIEILVIHLGSSGTSIEILYAFAMQNFKNPFIIGLISRILGSTSTYFLGRTVFRHPIEHWFSGHHYFRILKAIGRTHPWQMAILLKMIPMPRIIAQYGPSLIAIPFLQFILMNTIFGVPWQCWAILVGLSSRSLLDALGKGGSPSPSTTAIVVTMMTLMTVSMCFVVWYCRKIYKKVKSLEEEDSQTLNMLSDEELYDRIFS